ncbi:hypothetical protein SELMODRAFT_269103 [Selaginella moellendorffii]|uniref:t-SNARE coiled-coil homology domain-containing protein n=1 Tax=Selaginella moellendorffii TaxID=88036 RepID=D8SSB9_SELML|nr:syntaxin-22 [Selaginella moellendorffii]XP_024514726.1 syntaxin-22 [Selaginella moellendorffii]EFJ12714.1 hypothetical protein SELMODRAFT_269103 [Selaginella moellendorffii]|eukprot:XP_002986183.1 syntaxin-22 [Selaginella moellendorffii]
MSYQDLDLERGYPARKGDVLNGGQDPSQAVASGVFQINTAVMSYTRLMNQLGTAKDTPELRTKMHKMRQHISHLIKETAAKLKAVNETDRTQPVSASTKMKDAKLAKDFQRVLQTFEQAQKISKERQTVYAPLVPEVLGMEGASPDDERRILLAEQRRQEVLQLDNEVTFNEAVIEERAQGIREVQEQIEEVHEIFKDLAVMVHEQGGTIEEIDSHVENSYAATAQANKQLSKASKSQKSGNTLSCLLMVIFAVALVIVIIVLAA